MGALRSLSYKVLLSILSVLFITPFLYAAPVGKITYLKGRVDITSPGKKAILAKLGMPVSVGDIIRAKSNSKAEVTFNDGNILRLAQKTRVEITEYMAGEKRSSGILNLFRGRIQNIVNKKWTKKIAEFTKAHKFEVHTPIAVVGVKGTNFFTFHTPLGSGAAFKEGTGYCYPKNMPQRRVYVFPGQKVFIPSPSATPQVKPIPKTEMQRYERETAPEGDTGGTGGKGKGGGTGGGTGGAGGAGSGKGKGKGAKGATGGAGAGAGGEAGGSTSGEAAVGGETGAGGAGGGDIGDLGGGAGTEGSDLGDLGAGTGAGGAGAGARGEATAGGTGAGAGGETGKVYIPISETEPDKTMNITPPSITITKKPEATPTNSNTARFEWKADKPVKNYYYRLDDGLWVSTTKTSVEIPNLCEGEHRFEVKGVDTAGNESTPETYDWTTDYTPPNVTVTKKPATPTNSNKGRFEWKSDEPATYYYRLDDGSWVSTTKTSVEIPNLDEGKHRFEVKGVDTAGNESTPETYDWTTDYTPPNVTVDKSSSPALDRDKSDVDFTLTSNEPTTYNWDFDGTTGTAHGTKLSFSDVGEGKHEFKFTAEDEAGNSIQKDIPFELKRYRADLREQNTDNVAGEGSYYQGQATGDISAVIDDNWGGWRLSLDGKYSGTHSGAWDIRAGGSIWDSNPLWRGYWMYEAMGGYSETNMIGDSNIKVLTYHSWGEGRGNFLGAYDDQSMTWWGDSSGDYSHNSLRYSGEIWWADSWNEGPYYSLYGDNGSGGFEEIEDQYSLIGGIDAPWTEKSTIYTMGYYSAHEAPYIWNNDIYSYDFDLKTYTTYDGGAFRGFVGGVWLPGYSETEGDIDAMVVAIYLSPYGDVGYMRGDLQGQYWFDLEMMYAEGDWEPHKMSTYSGSPEGFYNAIKTDPNMTAEIAGGFGLSGIGGNINGINFNEGSWTRYLDGENWGIYDLIIDGYDSYSNPNNDTVWTAKMGGDAFFGTYTDNNSQYTLDYGYWIADVINGTWQDGKITADVNGRFLTLTKKGSIDGDLLGYYDANGHWAATSLGVYEGDTYDEEDSSLEFSSSIGNGSLSVLISSEEALHEGTWENSSSDEEQEYEYIDSGYGWGEQRYEDETDSMTEYFPDHTYVKIEKEDGKSPYVGEEGSWPAGFDVSSLGDSPGAGWDQTEGDSTSSANILDSAGTFDGILGGYIPEGGPDDLWTSTQSNPASIMLMGTLDINSQYATDYLLFSSEIKSFNPYNYTHTTPDGGAYWGWIGGIIDDVEGEIRALYIDPNGNAGILKGVFTGNDYRSIGMFEADGTMWAEKKATGVTIPPSEITDHIEQGYIFGDMHGYFDDTPSGSIDGSGSGHIAYIEGQSWGIYGMLFGLENTYDTSASSNSFNGKLGDSIIFDTNGIGFWIADIDNATSSWQDNRLYAELSGRFLTMRSKGIINGEVLGTYTENGTWQASSMGEWQKTDPLSFSSYIDTDLFTIISTTFYEGEADADDPNSDEVYEYEYISDGTGYAWKEQSNSSITSTEYFPDHTYVTLDYSGDGIPPYVSDRGEWPDDFEPSDVSTPPAGFTPDSSDNYSSSIIEEVGILEGIMGGTDSLWSASSQNPAGITFMGTIEKGDSLSNQPRLFSSFIRSYNPDNDSFTTIDGGAYAGYMAGNVDDINGIIYALYITPPDANNQKSAGYLKGSFNGSVYSGIEMWEADGTIYPNQMSNNIEIAPDQLINNLDEGFMIADVGNEDLSGMGYGKTLCIGGQEWGIYSLVFGVDTSHSNPQSSFTAMMGGMGEFDLAFSSPSNKDLGYWIAEIQNGTWADNEIFGPVSGNFLTMKKWGAIINGDFLGSYLDDPLHPYWQGISLGEWHKTDDLKFASYTEAEFYQFNAATPAFELSDDVEIPGAIMGGLKSIWTATDADPAETRFMGDMDNPGDNRFLFINDLDTEDNTNCFVSYNVNEEEYTTLDNGAYDGFMGGIVDGNNDSLQGLITAIYVDPSNGAGVLMGDFSGDVYKDIEMWEANGGVFPVNLNGNIGFSASELVDNITFDDQRESSLDTDLSVGSFTAGGTISALKDITRNAYIPGESWSIWQDMIGGTYNGSTSDTWEGYLFSADGNGDWDGRWEAVLVGNKWSENIIKADVAGAWVNWDQAITGVSGGRLVGTFDPNQSWQALAQGVGMETNRFLQMVQNGETDKLQQLKIPCFEIGRTTLVGSGGNITNVTMSDVIFFASQSGGVPRIWATNAVSGQYSGNPLNSVASLNSQAGGTANFNNVQFKITNWNTVTSKWGATVSGSNGTVGPYNNINMKGAAAGGFGGGQFAGTASGIAQQQ